MLFLLWSFYYKISFCLRRKINLSVWSGWRDSIEREIFSSFSLLTIQSHQQNHVNPVKNGEEERGNEPLDAHKSSFFFLTYFLLSFHKDLEQVIFWLHQRANHFFSSMFQPFRIYKNAPHFHIYFFFYFHLFTKQTAALIMNDPLFWDVFCFALWKEIF